MTQPSPVLGKDAPTCTWCGRPMGCNIAGGAFTCWCGGDKSQADLVNHPPNSRLVRAEANDTARFWSKVKRGNGCWLWTASTMRKRGGYGQFNIRRRLVKAHRFAWELTNGAIPDGLFVCHRCDNPPCCNPAHLFLGTDGDNTRDMRSKGRGFDIPPRRGEANHGARLTTVDVLRIRRSYASGEASMYAMAKHYGVSLPAIASVIHRRSWRHVP